MNRMSWCLRSIGTFSMATFLVLCSPDVYAGAKCDKKYKTLDPATPPQYAVLDTRDGRRIVLIGIGNLRHYSVIVNSETLSKKSGDDGTCTPAFFRDFSSFEVDNKGTYSATFRNGTSLRIKRDPPFKQYAARSSIFYYVGSGVPVYAWDTESKSIYNLNEASSGSAPLGDPGGWLDSDLRRIEFFDVDDPEMLEVREQLKQEIIAQEARRERDAKEAREAEELQKELLRQERIRLQELAQAVENNRLAELEAERIAALSMPVAEEQNIGSYICRDVEIQYYDYGRRKSESLAVLANLEQIGGQGETLQYRIAGIAVPPGSPRSGRDFSYDLQPPPIFSGVPYVVGGLHWDSVENWYLCPKPFE